MVWSRLKLCYQVTSLVTTHQQLLFPPVPSNTCYFCFQMKRGGKGWDWSIKLQLKLSFIEASFLPSIKVFHCGLVSIRLSSIRVMIHWGWLQISLSSKEVILFTSFRLVWPYSYRHNFGPSGVCAVPLVAGINEGGHYFRYWSERSRGCHRVSNFCMGS